MVLLNSCVNSSDLEDAELKVAALDVETLKKGYVSLRLWVLVFVLLS